MSAWHTSVQQILVYYEPNHRITTTWNMWEQVNVSIFMFALKNINAVYT